MLRGRVGVHAAIAAILVLRHVGALAASPADVPIAAAPVLDDRYPRAVVQFADVDSYPDLTYATLQGFRPLRLDLYKPRSAADRPGGYPLVVYIHGGGWQSGHTRHAGAFANWPAVLASLAARGYVVASIEYRLSGEAPFPAAIRDVNAALQWLKSKARDFDIDRSRTLVWGGSAGGQLAALAATSCGAKAFAPDGNAWSASAASAAAGQESGCVQGLVAWYGTFDFAKTPLSATADRREAASSPVGKFLGCSAPCPAKTIELASPVSHIDAQDPPTLLIHGELDKVVPVEQSREFYSALQSKHVAAELMVIPRVDHSFIGESEAATQAASRAALARTFQFIDATLRGKAP